MAIAEDTTTNAATGDISYNWSAGFSIILQTDGTLTGAYYDQNIFITVNPDSTIVAELGNQCEMVYYDGTNVSTSAIDHCLLPDVDAMSLIQAEITNLYEQ
jgi:hypothetical protein